MRGVAGREDKRSLPPDVLERDHASSQERLVTPEGLEQDQPGPKQT